MDHISDDVFRLTLSHLSPEDIATLALTSRRFARLITTENDNHDNDWWLICRRRWGDLIRNWRPISGPGAYRRLYTLLWRLERLVGGYWRGVVHNALVIFEWCDDSIRGFLIIQASKGSMDVIKVPFLWLGKGDGTGLLHYPTIERLTSNGNDGGTPGVDGSNAADVFSGLNPDWERSKLAKKGMVPVKFTFSSDGHFVLEEKLYVQRDSKRDLLAEAAASASLGAGHGTTTCSGSPPGSFPREMFVYMANKVTSPGSDRAARKQRYKERLWAESMGRKPLEPEHFIKVNDVAPTKARPLQGLWKGLRECRGMDMIQLSYCDDGEIVCRRMGNSSTSSSSGRSGSVRWTCESPPFSDEEREFYNSRTRIDRFSCNSDRVVEMLTSGDFRLENGQTKSSGRVWIYDNDSFGFGLLESEFITDFKLICS